MIPIAKPIIGKDEISEVVKVLKSGELTQGKWVESFESSFARFIGSKYAIATSSGTTALHLALLGAGLKKDDEIITTSFTFIASANSIFYIGAKPVFVDIDPQTLNLNPDLIEQKITKKTRAIMPVHLFGLPANMEKIRKVAKKHNLLIIEDAAQAHGAKIGNKFTGNFGDLAAFSFYPTKNMTTSEGGIITTNSKKFAYLIKMLRNHGMEKRYYHDLLGFNFRMTNIQAAIGIKQLQKLNIFNKKRIKNAQFLNSALTNIKHIQLPFIPQNYTHVFHQYTIVVKNGDRDKLANYLTQNEIGNMIYYPLPVHKQKFIKTLYPNLKLPITERLSRQVLSLPIHPSLDKKDLQKIVNSIKEYFEKI